MTKFPILTVCGVITLSTPQLCAADSDTEVTFSKDVAPIIFANCTSCHRPGESAPFSLTDYSEVRKRGRMIKRVVSSGDMPPWHPVSGHGDFVGERRLTGEEVALLNSWVDSDMPEGDPAATPDLPDYPDGWQFGQPDMIVTMPDSYDVPADGPDIYRQFCIPLSLDEDKWVRAVEVRPDTGGALHHVLIHLDSSGSARRLDEADPTPGFGSMGFRRSGGLGGWAVGAGPKDLPEGLAMHLPAGSDIVLSSHFHPTGKQVSEKTKIGLFFSDAPPERPLVGLQLPPGFGVRAGINIPAGESEFSVKDKVTLPVDTELISVGAHMHYLGKTARALAILPDGSSKDLFYINDWDFNWQDTYRYREPVRLPAGTRIEVELMWDNSPENPHNQFDPPRRVRWGRQSTDEMGSISFLCVAENPDEHAKLASALKGRFSTLVGGDSADAVSARRAIANDRAKDLMERFNSADANGDHVLSGKELPDSFRSSRLMNWLDKDGDGKITRAEAEAGKQQVEDVGNGKLGSLFKRLDLDGDGKLADAEIPDALSGRFVMGRVDKDGDGTISEAEFTSTTMTGAGELLLRVLGRSN